MGYGDDRWAELVHQIRVDPANDELRYVAADYLLSENDPRGELIVLARRLEAETPPTDYVVAYERYRELEKQLFAPAPGASWREVQRMKGGFQEEAFVDSVELLAQLPALCAREPITHLTICGTPITPAFLELDEFAEMRRLSVGLRSIGLLASPRFTSLEHLTLDTELRYVEVEALRDSPMRPHELEVDNRGLLPELAVAPLCENLIALPSDGDEIVQLFPDDGLRALARVDSTQLTAGGFALLGVRLDQLTSIRFHGVLDGVLPILAKHVTGARLRELSLTFRAPHIAELVAFLESSACDNLVTVELRGTPLPSIAEHALRRLASRGRLRT